MTSGEAPMAVNPASGGGSARMGAGDGQRCVSCGNAGWVVETNPAEWPVTLEVIPCLLPDCPWSGRQVDKIVVPRGVPVRPSPAV